MWWLVSFYYDFLCNCDACVSIKKIKFFLYVAYGQYPNMFWMLFFIQKILEVLKRCFRMDFLNPTKIIFLHFWILQHVCKTPKGIGQYSKKIKNLILGEIHLLFTVNVWIKKSQKDEYPKYLMGITHYYSLLIFG